MIDAPPSALRGLTLKLLPAGTGVLGMSYVLRTAPAGADGSFRFDNIPTGPYRLEVAPTPPLALHSMNNGRRLTLDGLRYDDLAPRRPGSVPPSATGSGSYAASLDLEVGPDGAVGVVLSLRPTATAHGRVAFEGDSSTMTAGSMLIRAEPSDGNIAAGVPHVLAELSGPVSSFALTGFLPASYFIRVSPPPGFALKSVTYAGREYLDEPLDFLSGVAKSDLVVTLTDKPSFLGGRVRNHPSLATTAGCVIVFPVDQSRWTDNGLSSPRIRMTGVDDSGAYRFSGLPAADYYVSALQDCGGELLDSSVMRGLVPGAKRVSVSWGGNIQADLEIRENR
jgi:hypothetical protein